MVKKCVVKIGEMMEIGKAAELIRKLMNDAL